jgi:hypothetical protein
MGKQSAASRPSETFHLLLHISGRECIGFVKRRNITHHSQLLRSCRGPIDPVLDTLDESARHVAGDVDPLLANRE